MSTSNDPGFSSPNVWVYNYVCKCGERYDLIAFENHYSFTLTCPRCERKAEQLGRPLPYRP